MLRPQRRRNFKQPNHNKVKFAWLSQSLCQARDKLAIALASYACLHCGISATRVLMGLVMYGLSAGAHAGVNADATGVKCPIFEGINASFMPWFIAFSAWVAWKRPELSALMLGSSKRPRYALPNASTPAERKQRKEWDIRTKHSAVWCGGVHPNLSTSSTCWQWSDGTYLLEKQVWSTFHWRSG